MPLHLNVIDINRLGVIGVAVPEIHGGVRIGRMFLADKVIIRTSWLLPSIVVPASMLIHMVVGNSRDFPFFISEADFPGLERYIFTVGLAISGLVQMLFAYRMWKIS